MKISITFFITLFLISCATNHTFYIVRHAEKEKGTASNDDPQLSQAGRDRATELEKWMANKKLDSVFTSTKQGTILTGMTVSLPQGVYQESVNQLPEAGLIQFVKRINEIVGNKNILIVGHTNTIPTIISGISVERIEAIPEDDYDNLFIITKKGSNKHLEHTNYGKTSP